MCDSVILHKADGTVLDLPTQGMLAMEIGESNIVVDDFDSASCLCPVDISASARKAGYISCKTDENEEYDPFDTHWYAQPSNKSEDGNATGS